jgi:predicted amidohydrolase
MMGKPFKIACVQITADREFQPNIDKIVRMIRRAGEEGVQLVTLPENCTMIEPVQSAALRKAQFEAEHPALPAFADAARDACVWLLIGSLSIKRDDGLISNRSFLMDERGEITARYDKIHLFDVQLANGETYRESDYVAPGDTAVLAPTPWGPLGMTVCYDLRFPYLYRALAQAGARYLAVPSAFTRTTGKAHWHTLLRARAIETGCYVIAPAQWGTHAEGRETFGYSLVVDPWGNIVTDGEEGENLVMAEIDPDKVDTARARLPSLSHDREYTVTDLTQKAPLAAE